MHYRLRTLLIVLVGLPTAGCSVPGCDPISGEPNGIPTAAEKALLSAREIELLSLDPMQPEADGDDRFHRWLVLGKTVIEDQETRGKLITALREHVPNYDDGTRAACFWPRHGIRVRDGNKTYDFLICFQCQNAGVFIDDQPSGGFLLSRAKPSPQPVFDDELFRAGVPLPKKSVD